MTPINTDDASQALGLPISTEQALALPKSHPARFLHFYGSAIEATFDIELGPEDIEEIE